MAVFIVGNSYPPAQRLKKMLSVTEWMNFIIIENNISNLFWKCPCFQDNYSTVFQEQGIEDQVVQDTVTICQQ